VLAFPRPFLIPTEAIKFLASQSLSHMVARDEDGWTPAHVASYYGRPEVRANVFRRGSLSEKACVCNAPASQRALGRNGIRSLMLSLCYWRTAPVVARAGSALSRGNSLQVLILMAKVSPSVLGIRTADGRTPADLAQSKVCKQVRL
jgi:hypothetical protein